MHMRSGATCIRQNHRARIGRESRYSRDSAARVIRDLQVQVDTEGVDATVVGVALMNIVVETTGSVGMYSDESRQ
jgi:hypothetical protein